MSKKPSKKSIKSEPETPEEKKNKYNNPSFDILDSITFTKKPFIVDEVTEKAYAPVFINKALSLFEDCIIWANEMNMNGHLDNKLQYDYLFHSIRRKKRWGGKWPKPGDDYELDLVCEYYGCNRKRGRENLAILKLFPEEIKKIQRELEKGGEK